MTVDATADTAATGKEKALWLLERLVPGTGVNNLGLALRADGRLRPDVLQAALAIMLDRHEALRTVFRAGDAADLFKWIVAASDFRVPFESIGSSDAPVQERLVAFTDRPFALDGSPLVRAGLAAEPDGDVLCIAVHHLAFDMVSMVLFLREFIGVYEAIRGGQPIPPAAPAPAAVAPSESRPEDVAYWRAALSGHVPGGPGVWFADARHRRPVMPGGTARHTLSADAQQALQKLPRACRAPVAAVLLAAYAALLASHGAGLDIVIGSPVDVRGANSAVIGYHVNVVPLRLHVDLSAGFRDLVRQARDAFLGAMAHAGFSVDELGAELGASGQNPLFRHLFNFLPTASPGELSIAGMPARLVTVDNPYSKFDLELVGTPSASEIWFRYARDVLSAADVETLLHRFEAVLIAAARDADEPIGATANWTDGDPRAERETANGPDTPEPPLDAELLAVLIGLWSELLNVEADAHTGFFEAGGHSLLAAVLAQKVADRTGISVPLPEIFENPSPAALAARLRA
ncbi:condensation domain-containing protein [Krasilnikovia sp. MM14-A1259]|uniref:condensation domain-containing protein n=1 Tax=Krasilnikovia sp. MM14-A1259 TaxID=3373539 RepID=UPI00382FB961